jgi:hypothetical protein
VSQLTRSIQDRLFVGILSAIFAPACGYTLLAVRSHPWAQEKDWFLRTFALLAVEGVSAVFFVAVFGLIWAIWTPDWIERRLKKAFLRFLLVVFAVGMFVTGICFYMAFFGAA